MANQDFIIHCRIKLSCNKALINSLQTYSAICVPFTGPSKVLVPKKLGPTIFSTLEHTATQEFSVSFIEMHGCSHGCTLCMHKLT